jgi:hypothetical protein
LTHIEVRPSELLDERTRHKYIWLDSIHIFSQADQATSNFHIQTTSSTTNQLATNQPTSQSINMSGTGSKMSQADSARIQSSQVDASQFLAFFHTH